MACPPGAKPLRGVMILIENNIPYRNLTIQTNLEAIAIRLRVARKITICNIYITLEEIVTLQQLQALLDQLPRMIIIVA